MRQNYFLLNVWMLLCLLSAVACNDDNIYFTQDETIGDIITGKQNPLEGNTLVLYTGSGSTVNVQGAKGEIHATSSDENIARATSDNQGRTSVVVQALNIGNTLITVTDTEGNSASFSVEVKDSEELWEKTTYVLNGEMQCVVQGATPADSARIATDAIAKTTETQWVVKKRPILLSEPLQRMSVYDKEEQLLAEGVLKSEQPEANQTVLTLYSDTQELLLRYTVAKDSYFVKSLTDDYREIYPEVKGVFVYIPFTTLR